MDTLERLAFFHFFVRHTSFVTSRLFTYESLVNDVLHCYLTSLVIHMFWQDDDDVVLDESEFVTIESGDMKDTPDDSKATNTEQAPLWWADECVSSKMTTTWKPLQRNY